MDKSRPGEIKLDNGATSDSSQVSAHHALANSRTWQAKLFEQRESYINRLVAGDHNVRAIYEVCVIHVVLFGVIKILRDSLVAGRLSVEIPLFYIATDDFNLKGIVAFMLTEALLLGLATLVYPALLVWKTIHCKCPILPVDIAFLLVYLLGLVSSFMMVMWIIVTAPLPAAFGFIAGVEQVRLVMKTYSFVRENAKKVIRPWNKDDTAGPASYYGGQMEPKVSSLANYLYFLFVPTLLYRDRYPRNNGPINWKNVIVYTTQCLTILWTAGILYQDMIMPSSLRHTAVVTSFLYSSLIGFIILVLFNIGILHSWMNLHAEILRFADRQFYTDWWTATSYAIFYRKWNIIIHDWIHAYVYTDVKNWLGDHRLRNIAPAFLSIAISSAIHEYLLAIALGFCLPLMSILFGGAGAILYIVNPCFNMKRASNIFILLTTGIGMGVMTFFYLLEYVCRMYCPPEQHSIFSSYILHCYQKYN